MRLSVTVGFRGSQHTYRPHPASLLVRVPAVAPLLHASFRLASRLPPCVSLQFSSLILVTTFQVTGFGPCRAHWERACSRRGRVSRHRCRMSVWIVPTLCVGMPPGTLRVPLSTQGSSLAQGDAERHGMHSHAEHGNDQVSRDGFWRTNHLELTIISKTDNF